MSKVADVKAFATELRPYIAAEIDRAEILKAMAKAARDRGVDWTQLKALVKAQELDAREGTDKRVAAIIDKADFAAAYADMLGFASNMNKRDRTCSSSIIAPDRPQKPVQQEPAAPAPLSAPPSQTAQALAASVAIARSGGDPFEIPDLPAHLDRRVRQ